MLAVSFCRFSESGAKHKLGDRHTSGFCRFNDCGVLIFSQPAMDNFGFHAPPSCGVAQHLGAKHGNNQDWRCGFCDGRHKGRYFCSARMAEREIVNERSRQALSA